MGSDQLILNSFQIAFWNACSLQCERYETEEFMNAHELEAVLICETWLQPGQRDPKIPGFTLHRTDRRDGEVGGPTIYVRNEIKHSASYVPDFRQLQATAVTVETAKGLLRLTAYYNTSATD